VLVFQVFRDPPEDFAEDLPLGCIADVEGKVLGVGGDEQVRTGEALETCDFKSEVAMGDNDELLVKVLALAGSCIDEEDGASGNRGVHGVALDMHAEHVLRMRAPGKRREKNVLHLGLRHADVFVGWNGITVGSNVH